MFSINFLHKPGLQKKQSKSIDNEIVNVDKDQKSADISEQELVERKEKIVFPKKYLFLIVVVVFLSLIAYD